ncbi:MAG: amino acid permease [Promethearchaeota archaeon]
MSNSDLILGLILLITTGILILVLVVFALIKIQINSRSKSYVLNPIAETGDDIVFSSDLSRDMTLTQATMTGVGAMIGAGIFVLTGIAAGIAGPALLLAFIFNGLIATLIAFIYAELGSAIPEAGGGYTYAKQGLGHMSGFFSGWMSWFAITVAGSLYSLGFAAYFLEVLESVGIVFPDLLVPILERIIALSAIVIFLLINQIGSSTMGKAELWISTIKVLILGAFIFAGLLIVFSKPNPSSNITPFFPKGYSAIFVAMGFTFIAFEGYEVIVQTGEEIYDPKTNIPKAVVLSIIMVIPIYVFVGLIALTATETPSGETTWQFLSDHEELGLLEAANKMIPTLGFIIIMVGGLLSTLSALNASIYSSTRVGFALGRDNLLPRKLAYVSPHNRTPTTSIWMTGLIMCLMAGFIPIEAVAAAADIMFLLLFFIVCIAAIRIRRKFDNLNYGFKTPLFPLIPVIGCISIAIIFLFILTYHMEAFIATIIWLTLGSTIFLFYARDKLPTEEIPGLAKYERVGFDGLPEEFFTTTLLNILVPIAGKDFELDAVRIASLMAQEFGAQLTLYHYGDQPKEVFDAHLREVKRLNITYTLKITPYSNGSNKIHPMAVVQHLVDISSMGQYQLAVFSSRRRTKRLERWFGTSISHTAIEKIPIPALQVFQPIPRMQNDKLGFENVATLLSGTQRDFLLLQIGRTIVSSIRGSALSAYHFTEVPHLTLPRIVAESSDVREESREFIKHVGDMSFLYGVAIKHRFVLGHDFVRSLVNVKSMDGLDLLILGGGRHHWGQRLSERLTMYLDCTVIVLHGEVQ